MSTATSVHVGVDVGGTHTDAAAIIDGRVERGKALTTYDDFSRGVLEAVGVAAEAHGRSLEDLLADTGLFVNGTTVVTNTITTLQGAKVGAIVTRGFRDTFRFAGGTRLAIFDDMLQSNVPDLISRSAIAEVTERTDYSGERLVAVDAEELKAAARRLVEEEKVESIALCFLNSHADPGNELEAGRILGELYPDLFVTLSHKIFPLPGENRRWYTAVLNCFVQQRAAVYVDSLNNRLREAGLGGGLVFVQGLGGGIGVERAKEYPLALLGSGPAGGAIGAVALAESLGLDRVLLGDMGGTSFDTGMVVDGEIALKRNLDLDLFKTGVSLVDVVSVGAGGGSIVEVSEREVPQVGPRSAASTPGPAAYGRGGEEPTVTDAMVTLGFIDPDNYLGGRFQLDPKLAADALDQRVGAHFDWSTEEVACAVHDLVVVNMATAMREISVGKGHDPRDFVFLAYGGTLPLFAVQIARRLGMDKVVIPQNSSVFCALGFLSADFVQRSERAINWDLHKPEEYERVNPAIAEVVEEARETMRREGFADDEIEIARTVDVRFAGQAFELTLPLEDRELTAEDAPQLEARFLEAYEATYGEGTAWSGVPAVLLTFAATAVGRQQRPDIQAADDKPTPEEEMRRETRTVFLPAERESREVPVYEDAKFTAGSSIQGPAIIDATDTTVYVPAGVEATRDKHLNFILADKEGSDQ